MLVILVGMLAWAGCGTDALAWQVRFVCALVAQRADVVELQVVEGNCPKHGGPSSAEVVYQTTVHADGSAAARPPGELSPGTYAFLGQALDVEGRTLATACAQVTLPRAEPITLFLRSDAACVEAFGDGGVVSGDGGMVDPDDACPDDRAKREPGQCGCGVKDSDRDKDGTADCIDECDDDELKTSAGVCGCGVADVDGDGDAVLDCDDGCPSDSQKVDPGVCGCGTPDTDMDVDGTVDCRDGCPNDPLKTQAGICGCGAAEDSCERVSLPLDDAFVTSSSPDQNFGTSGVLEVDAAPSIKRALIKPQNLAGIPAGAVVMSARLVLHVFDVGDALSVREATASWSEDTVTYNSVPACSALVSTLAGSPKGAVSLELTDVVQGWVDGTPLHGVCLVGSGDDGVDMYSSEHSNAAQRPALEVTWRE